MSKRSDIVPNPARWPWRICPGKKCGKTGNVVNINNVPLTGNINLPTHMLVCSGRGSHKYSISIRAAFDISHRGKVNCYSRPITKSISYLQPGLTLNAFGKWEGAPGGSGSPPRNRF